MIVEHGYLRGTALLVVDVSAASEGRERRTLMDHVIDVVTRCSEEYDESVHLQVMKVLLMALTSQHCQVHESSLLQAVRACFQIHLITKSQVNKTTAKAALTQMLSIVFQRMEAFDARAKADTEATLAAFNSEQEENAVEEEAQEKAFGHDGQIAPSPAGQCMYGEVFAALGFAAAGADPLPPNDFTVSAVAGSAVTHSFASILHKDAFLIFRALCKLSMKGLNDDSNSPQDPIALQNKILSLELILHILQRSGPAFRSGEKFIYAIKQYLCVSLLGNCTSPIAQVTTLSLQIFVSLLNGFKEHLKQELEIFVGSIFLKILESENSTFEHKSRVLEVLQNFCLDPAAQIELFINYDCDIEGNDLFRRIVDAFSKIAKNPILPRSAVDFMSSKKSVQEEQTIRFMALEGLVIVLKSMLRSTSFGVYGEQSTVPPASGSMNTLTRASSNIEDPSAAEDDVQAVGSAAPAEDSVTTTVNGTDVSVKGGDNLVDAYGRKHKTLSEIETGIIKFNLSPKKGLAYLASLGHIEMSPRSVAMFLRDYQDKLDKTAVGEYLGKEVEYEGGFCIKVLHEYVDSMDFTNMHFDIAIRHFLAGFRIPGESQKIDRMMEKFAERYYLQNRNVFASADMAFILAFSTIMLQTNLHNPAIRDDKRMTKEQFLRQNKGISADGELPDDMLMDIYDRIAASPITLLQDDKEKKRLAKKDEAPSFFSTDKRRKDAYNDERKEIMKAGEALFKQNMRSKRAASVFVRAAGTDEAYVRPMYEAAWPSMLSVFSQNYETGDDDDLVALCLEGFQYSIRLGARLGVSTARETFINALSRFTTLDSVKEMKKKNAYAVQSLIHVALIEGDFMHESWGQLLKTFSQLARLYAIGSGAVSDEVHDGRESTSRARLKNARSSVSMQTADQISRFFIAPSKADTTKVIEEANADLLAEEVDSSQLDRIYLNSQTLSSESVQHFVNNLCAVSKMEISPQSNEFKGRAEESCSTPRVFSLQKIVEVADCNMNCRPRIAWTNMWSVLAMHFTTVGINDNHALAMYAIDSLKQLSIKFLQKVELSNFNFQRLFLKPFEVIMNRSRSNEIKELILGCMDVMIRACAQNIRSGWRSIFSIFSVAAGSESLDLSTIAFSITEQLVTRQFDLLIFDFVEVMNCLVSFIAGVHTSLSLNALSHLSGCADHLANGDVSPALENPGQPADFIAGTSSVPRVGVGSELALPEVAVEDEASSVFRLWWPLLLGLSTRISDQRLEVRNCALDVLFKVLQKHGHLFSTQTWEVVFRGVLFPVMESAKTDQIQQPHSAWPTQKPPASHDPNSWIATTAGEALRVFIKLFHQFRPSGQTYGLLNDMLGVLDDCINQDIEPLALLGLGAFNDFVLAYDDSSNYPMEKNTRSVIADRLCSCLLKNLCLDFGECGILELDQNTSTEVRHLLFDCPVAHRRRFKNPEQEIGKDLMTPYGIGRVMNVRTFLFCVMFFT